MAVVPIHSSMFSKDQVLPVSKLIKQSRRSIIGGCIAIQKVCRCFSSISGDRRWHVLCHTAFQIEGKTRQGTDAFCKGCKRMSMSFQTITEVSVLRPVYKMESHVTSGSKNALQREKSCMVSYASESSINERQLKALDSYFSKLHKDINQQQASFVPSRDSEIVPDSEKHKMDPSSQSPGKTTELLDRSGQFKAKKGLGSLDNYLGKLNAELLDRSGQFKAKKGLGSLDNYLGKLNAEVDSQKNTSFTSDHETNEENPVRTPYSVIGDYKKSEEKKLNSHMQLGIKDDELGLGNSQDLPPPDETSDIYLICILASINIAVFLFEIASPIRNSEIELLSLPSLYGAKINQLILVGEWWRLVTPMFLHSGLLHVALGCWVLLTFGPQVCKGYGSCTFFLIYILGGISGNFTSYIHTPEPTVGGTGPVFAIIGAWLIYQIQNKKVIGKEVSESMFQKAVIATALSFILSNFGPIDDWTHLGAACAGIVYGFLTCPTLQLDNASSKTGQEDGIALVRRYADPCKSLITFVVFIVVLSSLLFFLEPQVNNTLEVNSLI